MLVALAASTACLPATAQTASPWQTELVDSSGQARYSSMKADDDGNLHLVYVIEDGNTFPLRYAIRDHRTKSWFVMTIAKLAGPCTLTLDSKQRPHIVYGDWAGGGLHHAYWDGSQWISKPIPLPSELISYYNSIVLDAKDNPSISFYEYRGPKDSGFKIRLRTVMYNGQYWELRTVDGEEGSGKFNAMAIDGQGRIHLAYANVGAGNAGMRYAYWADGEWHTEVVEGMQETQGHYVGYSTNIAVDKQGNPHLTYMDNSSAFVKYAVRNGGRWQIQAVDALVRTGYPDRNSIIVDEQGRPYIGYYDAGRGILKVAHREGDKWFSETVDGNGSGFTSSLQISQGTLWISYADDRSGGLKVGRRQLDAVAPAASQLSGTEQTQLEKERR
jgi:hypothetical protein